MTSGSAQDFYPWQRGISFSGPIRLRLLFQPEATRKSTLAPKGSGKKPNRKRRAYAR